MCPYCPHLEEADDLLLELADHLEVRVHLAEEEADDVREVTSRRPAGQQQEVASVCPIVIIEQTPAMGAVVCPCRTRVACLLRILGEKGWS